MTDHLLLLPRELYSTIVEESDNINILYVSETHYKLLLPIMYRIYENKYISTDELSKLRCIHFNGPCFKDYLSYNFRYYTITNDYDNELLDQDIFRIDSYLKEENHDISRTSINRRVLWLPA